MMGVEKLREDSQSSHPTDKVFVLPFVVEAAPKAYPPKRDKDAPKQRELYQNYQTWFHHQKNIRLPAGREPDASVIDRGGYHDVRLTMLGVKSAPFLQALTPERQQDLDRGTWLGPFWAKVAATKWPTRIPKWRHWWI